MAGILKRFGDIMSANINSLLDKCEDPEKMIDQYLRDMQDDLGKVKAETASVMAAAKSARREAEECEEQIGVMQNYAEKALVAGNEADAKQFLAKKQKLEGQLQTLKTAADNAEQNADHMRQMHDKLQHDISELEERKSEIKAKVAAAKTQERMNDLTEKIGKTAGAGAAGKSAFDRMEKKADEMLDAANARAELNQSSAEEQSIEDLTKKYDSNGSESSVDDELAAMKAKLGL